jgi:hypothetical protein
MLRRIERQRCMDSQSHESFSLRSPPAAWSRRPPRRPTGSRSGSRYLGSHRRRTARNSTSRDRTQSAPWPRHTGPHRAAAGTEGAWRRRHRRQWSFHPLGQPRFHRCPTIHLRQSHRQPRHSFQRRLPSNRHRRSPLCRSLRTAPAERRRRTRRSGQQRRSRGCPTEATTLVLV